MLPALVVLVVVVGLACAPLPDEALFPDDAVSGLRGDSLAALGWVANWRFAAARTDYFAQGGTASLLQHTSSLGVEEQYYLVWPLLPIAVSAGFGLLVRRGRMAGDRGSVARRRVVGTVAAIGAALSAVEAVVLTGSGPIARVYFCTDTRAQALLLGHPLERRARRSER